MTGENSDETGRLRTLLVGVLDAAVTGRADPVPAHRPWPRWLAWTRWIGVGRLPYGLVVALVGIGLTVALTAGSYSLLQTETARRGLHPGDRTLLFSAALVCLPLLLRDRHPLAAWRLSFLAMALVDVGDWLTVPYVPAGSFVAMACLYTVAVRCPRNVTVGAGLISLAGALIKDAQSAPGAILLLLLALLVGYTVRLRTSARRALAEQEKRHQDAEAVLTERQRIARELHDVVAHHMSMIAIQAEAAPYKVAELPDETRTDLAEIRATALDALTELRRVLGVLRSADGAETAPQPGLDRLDELVAHARGTGLAVTEHRAGDLDRLPPGVALTAYRIVQEALSNAMRHAPGSRVRLNAERAGGILRLEIVNGPAPPGRRPTPSPPGGGHGLVGMRERAAMLGGTLAAGPTPEGGFAVTAALPVKDPR
ncbi:sensor histidine kinase [Actinomadura hibisca]|uniref:sensor histidine kinase n=1 Tax=Actinomadura hibisca TaxID=68565 RepID=UPI000A04BB2B|nr:sensor histidine kinase [Actinomadura hibisca]